MRNGDARIEYDGNNSVNSHSFTTAASNTGKRFALNPETEFMRWSHVLPQLASTIPTTVAGYTIVYNSQTISGNYTSGSQLNCVKCFRLILYTFGAYVF